MLYPPPIACTAANIAKTFLNLFKIYSLFYNDFSIILQNNVSIFKWKGELSISFYFLIFIACFTLLPQVYIASK